VLSLLHIALLSTCDIFADIHSSSDCHLVAIIDDNDDDGDDENILIRSEESLFTIESN
jgi:hypothetical protein